MFRHIQRSVCLPIWFNFPSIFYCLGRITVAIHDIARTVAIGVQDSESCTILPTLDGVRSFCPPRRGHFCSDMTRNSITGLLGLNGVSKDGGISSILGSVCKLYHGSVHSYSYQNNPVPEQGRTVACSESGVCVYIDSLRSLTCQTELLHAVHILPGKIIFRNHQYDKLTDFCPKKGTSAHAFTDWVRHTAELTPVSTEITYHLNPATSMPIKIELVVTEDEAGMTLGCAYRISNGALPTSYSRVRSKRRFFGPRVLLDVLSCHVKPILPFLAQLS